MSSKKVISEALQCGNSETITIARTHVESGINIAFNLISNVFSIKTFDDTINMALLGPE
jgi:hypothetical protein